MSHEFVPEWLVEQKRAVGEVPEQLPDVAPNTVMQSMSNKTSEERPQFLYLTTVGRQSGKPREIEIWFTELEGRYYVIAEYPTANWVRNIAAQSAVQVRVGNTEFAATGRIVEPALERELYARVQKLSEEKYGWGDGLVVELAPTKNE